MGWKDEVKNFGKKVESFGRDIRDSEVGQKATGVAEDIGKSVRDWWKSDKVQNKLKSIEHNFREVRDDLVKSLKPLPKEEQEAGLKKFDEYQEMSTKALNDAPNEKSFETTRGSILDDLVKISAGLRGAEKNSDDDIDVTFSGNAEFVPETRALNEDPDQDSLVGVSSSSVDDVI